MRIHEVEVVGVANHDYRRKSGDEVKRKELPRTCVFDVTTSHDRPTGIALYYSRWSMALLLEIPYMILWPSVFCEKKMPAAGGMGDAGRLPSQVPGH